MSRLFYKFLYSLGVSIVFLLAPNTVLGVENAPLIRRICMNQASRQVSVYFNPSTDNCGSFTRYKLYGRDALSSPWVYLGESLNRTVGVINYTLPNLKDWEFFISAHDACNGTDSFKSNLMKIDNTPPVIIEPDSVSVDLLTQRLQVGWTKSSEPDVMGYSVFKIDPTNGNNLLITEADSLRFLFSSTTFNVTQANNKVCLAAFDSCRNGGIISSFHSPALLNFDAAFNANYLCSKKIRIVWTPYSGWNTDNLIIYVRNSITNVWQIAATIANNIKQDYEYTLPLLNASYEFFVRSVNNSKGSSSSNLITQFFATAKKPDNLTMVRVSTVTNQMARIDYSFQGSTETKAIVLQKKAQGSTSWLNLQNNTSSNTLTNKSFDDYFDATKTKNDYRLVAINNCDEVYDSSVAHNNIVLTRDKFSFTWNNYINSVTNETSGSITQRLAGQLGFNLLSTPPSTSHIISDTSNPSCFRIQYTGNLIGTVYSNVICIRSADTTYIPNAFTPNFSNPRFKIVNPNLLPGDSKLLIFNRWGQKLYEGDALEGWDGKYMGSNTESGFYPYLIYIKTKEKKQTFKGTVLLIN